MRYVSVVSIALLMLAPILPRAHAADDVPCSCLQELWIDYPGPNDLYFSLDHITSCDDEGEEGLWYGVPSNSELPELCEYANCEHPSPPNRAAAIFPGHGQELVGVKAWEIFHVGLESAVRKAPGLEFGSPTYHVIPNKTIQIDSAGGVPITKAEFENCKFGHGSQLSVKYQLKSGEVRKGLVWLK